MKFLSVFLCACVLCGSCVEGESRFWLTIPELSLIPGADDEGIVIKTDVISFPSQQYNASIVRDGDGFLLASRQDLPGTAWPIPYSMVPLWHLNSSFQVQGGSSILNLIDNHSEDPRLFYANGVLNLMYVRVYDPQRAYKCGISLAKINSKTAETLFKTDLVFPGIAAKEKNWTPLAYREDTGEDSVYFIYAYNPLKVLRFVDEKKGLLEVVCSNGEDSLLSEWESKWGKIRGGTPAIQIGENKYLVFFHSTFRTVNYVMGAIVLEVNPPSFKVKKISPYPIMFQGIYEAPRLRPGKNGKNVIFPSGLAEGVLDGKDVLYLSCGENDTTVRIVTIDKAALLNSLIGRGKFLP
jgi:predicted GH43/DUF377 family glycosyl hydrolase